MEKLHYPFLLFLLQFFSLLFLSLAYNLPDKYFINCGSKANINIGRRTFIGDSNSGTFSFTAKNSITVEDGNQFSEPSSLYKSARIFRQPSFYEFGIESDGTYFVRLHFSPFTSSTLDLNSAIFNVSASGFSLLHNFTARNSSRSPVVKELLLTIKPGKFKVYFVPQDSSFAFINAIEVFLTPSNFIPDEAQVISPAGSNSSLKGILSLVLNPIYRINVGGAVLTSDHDILWRNWDVDDHYLKNPNAASNSSFYQDQLKYQDDDDKYIAPDLVYKTAKEVNMDVIGTNPFNLSWVFTVRKSTKHLVRVHFCDIISKSLRSIFFNLYIGNNFSKKIDSADFDSQLAVPFHIDYVVGSDDSGVMNISIGTTLDYSTNNGYLNGLEIMEITEVLSSVPVIRESTKSRVVVVVGSVVGGLVFVCILVFVILVGLKRRKEKPVENSDWTPMPPYGGGRGSSHSRVTGGTVNASPVHNLGLGLILSFAELQSATSNFDKKFLIGKGGFGNVYRGTLKNGTKVAVKRSQPGSNQGLSEFKTEILILSRIRQRHLVSLIGYCNERSEMILVYEFMEKGTLRDHLYSSSNLPRLSWKQRLEICIGAARGLHYLHKGSAGGIIHRDVKSTNILLDENLVAKVADFGLSRTGTLGEAETHVSTVVKGTFGYLDPEYFRTSQLTEKSDVYSFGVVLLEVLCARPAIDPLLPREQVNLAEWGIHYKNKGLLELIVDPSLKDQINPSSLRKFGETAEKCLQESAADRPTMADVLWDLEYALQLQQTPIAREPHDDSITKASSADFQLHHIQHLPSLKSTIDSEIFSPVRSGESR